MPIITNLQVLNLTIDLNNYRTLPQNKEIDAINAMLKIKGHKFHAIIESLIHNGYIRVENIVIQKRGDKNIVREGNRRIAALKIIHGIYKLDKFKLPNKIVDLIKNIPQKWKDENNEVPCIIFSPQESKSVNKIVALTHGKHDDASRDAWTSVARARHNRDELNGTESGLTLLEKYLSKGRNLSIEMKEEWSGDYPLTILNEGLKKIYPHLNLKTVDDIAQFYPKVSYREELEDILLHIGKGSIEFKDIRSDSFPSLYGIKTIQPKADESAKENDTNKSNSSTTTASSSNNKKEKQTSHASNDPKNVISLLKKFTPKGDNREKVVLIKNELKNISITKTPLAFCFLVRSIFEISSKAYCHDHGLEVKNEKGEDKTLSILLELITNHLTLNGKDKAKVKLLHAAGTELTKSNGILSVTSMNQLIHNPKFSVIPSDICTVFSNIFPLLEEMNQ